MTLARRRQMLLLVTLLAAGCGGARSRAPSPAPPTALAVHTLALPGAPTGGVLMDYLAYDRAHHRVWVPAGGTGSVYVVDTLTEQVARVEGFPTAEVERHGSRRTVGPSAATVGDGVVYVGNRAGSRVCAVDAESLRVGPCVGLDSTPDGLAYVASTREVWVTTPRDRSIVILDAAAPGALRRKATITLDGQPEGFAVDDGRGVFYTNLEDQDRTLAIAVGSRQVTSTWLSGCGEGGPKGLAIDPPRDVLLVACRDRVLALDAGRGGTLLSTIAVGDGIDNIEYVLSRHELYAAAARAGTLAVARLDDGGRLTLLASVATAAGARNAVVTDEGTAYLTDAAEGAVLVVAPVRRE